MVEVQAVKIHAGRYFQKKNAESLADYLRQQGEQVEVVEATCYDVIVIEHMEETE